MKHYLFYTLVVLATAVISCKDSKVQNCDDPVSFTYDVPFELCQGSIGDMIHPLEVEFAGRTIRLLSVSPDPMLGTIPQNEYKLTLVVAE